MAFPPLNSLANFEIHSQYFIQFGAAQVGGGPDDPNQPTAAFRIPWGIQMVPAFILFVGLFFFPSVPKDRFVWASWGISCY